ncbi:L-rhamnose mutarotase [Natronorubrum halophilum]|uniref:L-rhamnose mutarotase n=1 Tax=Natronorubrum halophilum TaxID=1702106 RepID=UPI0010C1B629|nr:L-rhamnose mutarotase [Natronorubrum halophilum]
MARIAFHLQIADGKRDEYREAHESVPDWLEDAYLDSDAELENYSVFEQDGHVFGFLELENPEAIKEVMETSDAQACWAEQMDGIIVDDDSDQWMDEVYRMI